MEHRESENQNKIEDAWPPPFPPPPLSFLSHSLLIPCLIVSLFFLSFQTQRADCVLRDCPFSGCAVLGVAGNARQEMHRAFIGGCWWFQKEVIDPANQLQRFSVLYTQDTPPKVFSVISKIIRFGLLLLSPDTGRLSMLLSFYFYGEIILFSNFKKWKRSSG